MFPSLVQVQVCNKKLLSLKRDLWSTGKKITKYIWIWWCWKEACPQLTATTSNGWPFALRSRWAPTFSRGLHFSVQSQCSSLHATESEQWEWGKGKGPGKGCLNWLNIHKLLLRAPMSQDRGHSHSFVFCNILISFTLHNPFLFTPSLVSVSLHTFVLWLNKEQCFPMLSSMFKVSATHALCAFPFHLSCSYASNHHL